MRTPPVDSRSSARNPRSSRGPAILCAAIALFAGVVAAVGVFARGDGAVVPATSVRGVEFDMATTGVYAYNAQRVVAEGVGWDLFTLLVAVPALGIAAVLVNRDSFRGALFGLGVLGYFLYQYLEYSVTWAFGPLFLAFVILYAASLLAIGWIGAGLARDGVAGRFTESFPRRGWAVLSTAMALLLTLMWLGRINLALGGDLAAAGLTSETTLTIQALDLGLVVPALLVSAVLGLRRRDVGYAITTALAVTFVGMAAAIASMLLSAWAVEGTLEIVPVAIFGLAAAMGIGVSARAFRSVTPSADPGVHPSNIGLGVPVASAVPTAGRGVL